MTSTPEDAELRMNAYYYAFAFTGVFEIDRILSAVACAGKSFHMTADWGDDAEPWPHLRGNCAADWIQNAADDAAEKLKSRLLSPAIDSQATETVTREDVIDEEDWVAFLHIESSNMQCVQPSRAITFLCKMIRALKQS
jgi:hypothetical protein